MASSAHGTSAGSPALTERQQRILGTIARSIRANGYAPTMREIGEAVGLQSPSSVSHQLSELERKGYIRKDPKRPRTLWLVDMDDEGDPLPSEYDAPGSPAVNVPLVGTIAAGIPITAEEQVEDVFALPAQLVGDGELFLLKVQGLSLIHI